MAHRLLLDADAMRRVTGLIPRSGTSQPGRGEDVMSLRPDAAAK
jgi:hypothetical protein